ncbi:hypothetical protein QJ856_gp0592 [Tupanvirus deep ocean]|uniref:Uncharacterized protein n=2 Tax=Tupanvirus TaxID=2094720 RepID=A0AC62A8P7_9VIRU|nr:hypothetical protein QJ856_gp0592 [Tupanvirus deep ocean]QKU34154.1 hypothetical protein [Tupanvirus deep ocean]
MPNDVANFVIITGDSAEVKRFWAVATTSNDVNKNGKFCYDNIYPTPDGVDWYVWRIKNWGNKWGCYDVDFDISQIDNGIILLSYDTAWSSSTPFWTKITKVFKIRVKNYFHDEGSIFCGKEEYHNGNIIYSIIFNSYKIQKEYFKKYAKICAHPHYYGSGSDDSENE